VVLVREFVRTRDLLIRDLPIRDPLNTYSYPYQPTDVTEMQNGLENRLTNRLEGTYASKNRFFGHRNSLYSIHNNLKQTSEQDFTYNVLKPIINPVFENNQILFKITVL